MLTHTFSSPSAPPAEADGLPRPALDGKRLGKPMDGIRHGWPPEPGRQQAGDGTTDQVDGGRLEITPVGVVDRHTLQWDGIAVELVQCATHDHIQFRFRAPSHLLIAYQEGVRDDGETLIDGAARSTLRILAGKLTFVPAGCGYFDWQRPRVRSRMICFYFDPAVMTAGYEAAQLTGRFSPRVFFENNQLLEAAIKLAAAIEDNPEAKRYCEALAVVVAHELLCFHGFCRQCGAPARGGLAAWQKRIVGSYIEDHLAESIPIASLAGLAELSSCHFCRAFKQSFGKPPHRYHIARRINRAKALLENPGLSITEAALALGFTETSSFSTAFRRTTGLTPTAYRRSRE